MLPSRHHHRRGVLLLVILGLLAMFGLVAVAFVVVSGQALRTAQIDRRIGQYDLRPEEDLHEAFLQAVRGTNSGMGILPDSYLQPRSVLETHSLLEDLYGWPLRPSLPLRAERCIAIGGGQIIRLGPFQFGNAREPLHSVGCVLTMLDGPAKGCSTRIVGCRPDPTEPELADLMILAFDGVQTQELYEYLVTQGKACEVLINGAPFSGAGFGYHEASPLLNAWDPDGMEPSGPTDPATWTEPGVWPYALLPNPTAFRPNRVRLPGQPEFKYVDPAGPGGANEDYDAVDFQNMLLAAQIQTDAGLQIIPSLHRPELVRYWVKKYNPNWDPNDPSTWGPALRYLPQSWPLPADAWVKLKRKIILRPLPELNFQDLDGDREFDDGEPYFTGSNPAYVPGSLAYQTGFNPLWNYEQVDRFGLGGQPDALPDWDWDVDNDGDGRADGIWVDLGLPVRAMPDGQLYKPLFSFLCVDLDGRLNLNVHGCLAQAEGIDINNDGQSDRFPYYEPLTQNYLSASEDFFPFAGGRYGYAGAEPGNQNPIAVVLPRGQGYGPAEINLLPLFSSVDDYAKLLKERYGPDVLRDNPAARAVPGRAEYAGGPIVSGDDPLSWNKWCDYGYIRPSCYPFAPTRAPHYWLLDPTTPSTPVMANRSAAATGVWGSPPNPQGDAAIGLDPAGRPLYCGAGIQRLPYDGRAIEELVRDERLDDPYELDCSGWAACGRLTDNQPDSPFTAAELEPLLRPFDADARRLDSRLLDRTADASSPRRESVLHAHRHEITVESRDVPCPGVALPEWLRQKLLALPYVDLAANQKPISVPDLRLHHPIDLLLARLEVELGRDFNRAEIEAHLSRLRASGRLTQLVPRELVCGLRMDINRPFGNGADDVTVDTDGNNSPDAGNNVVDEPGWVIHDRSSGVYVLSNQFPGEIHVPGFPDYRERLFQVDAQGKHLSVELDHVDGVDVNGDGKPNPALQRNERIAAENADRALARQLYARYLYVLTWLMVDPRGMPPGFAGTKPQWDALAEVGRQKEWARAIAQWAVNVVDFRDRDSIMTPFEYDIYPFTNEDTANDHDGVINTWDVDGVIEEPTAGGRPPEDSDDFEQTHPWRGLVWGCERPELLITETLAFHDRRTQDLGEVGQPSGNNDYCNTPDNEETPDEDFDQKHPPEGTLLVELYNPWTALEPGPGELYGTRGGVLLSRTAGSSPVWRMVIYRHEENQPIDPDDPTGPKPDRSIYFVDGSEIDITDDGIRHYPANNPATNQPWDTEIRPGRYAVVGPGNASANGDLRGTTYIGFLNNQSRGDENTRRIVLRPKEVTEINEGADGQVDIFFNEDTGSSDQALKTADPRKIQPPMAVRVDKAVVDGTPQSCRLSVSEPPGGYTTVDAEGNDLSNGVYQVPYDVPLDRQADPDFYMNYLIKNKLHRSVFEIHLQRLANPLRPWSKTSNPYRTIDTMPVDLATFNGMPPVEGAHSGPEPGEDGAFPANKFVSRERGENTAPRGQNWLWPSEPFDRDPYPNDPDEQFEGTANHKFTAGLHHTLGYLNYYSWGANPTVPNAPGSNQYTGPREDPNFVYLGEPWGQPFPWLTWNNRPFVSQLELLLVPGLSARELLHYPNPANPLDKRGFGLATGASNPYDNNPDNDPFRHLWNFFQSARQPQGQPSESAAELHRVLELLGVPSRFVGAEIQCNPKAMSQPYDPADPSTEHSFRPPFHWISRYRDPGRINLNTVFSPTVWQGLMNYYPHMDPSVPAQQAWQWQPFLQTRRGFPGNPLEIDPNYPTRFAGVFRSPGSSAKVPLAELRPAREVNATLLRQRDAQIAGAQGGSADNLPLLGRPANHSGDNPTFYNDFQRNPYFRYQGLQRLGNLVTTRSNVYAIWITVGYFKVHPNPLTDPPGGVDDAHPDGYALGQELGIETGEVRRHRAFYIFDRSIPVGFERGCDHNVEKAILLKRFIE